MYRWLVGGTYIAGGVVQVGQLVAEATAVMADNAARKQERLCSVIHTCTCVACLPPAPTCVATIRAE